MKIKLDKHEDFKVNLQTMRMIALLIMSFIVLFIILMVLATEPTNIDDLNPTPTPTHVPFPTITPMIEKNYPISGKASYYSEDACLGCNEELIMANGDILDDQKLTVAYNDAPLNTHIKIVNANTQSSIIAKVTDRGGFKRHGKIIDLSVASKEALGCGDVCDVIIYEDQVNQEDKDNYMLANGS